MNARQTIEEYADRLAAGTHMPPGERTEARHELVAHLHDKARELAGGPPEAHHAHAAIAALGSADQARAAFFAGGWHHVDEAPAQPAHMGRRLAAYAIDIMPLLLVAALVASAFGGVAVAGYIQYESDDMQCRGLFAYGISLAFFEVAPTDATTPCDEARQASGIAGGTLFVLAFLYFGILESSLGTTLGKQLLGLRVRRVDGDPAGAAAWLRNLVKGILPLAFIDYMLSLTSPRRQSLLDRGAHTVVVKP